jgi:sulfopyruvate decarboxylase subunit beta
MIDLADALAAVRDARSEHDVVIATMSAARAWMEMGTHPLDMIFVPSSMGHATSFGLGIAMAQPRRRVFVCNGDGSMLMNLGSLVTIAAAAPSNLVILVLDNGVYEVTGAQPLPGRPDYAAIARASGIGNVHHFPSPGSWAAGAAGVLASEGPVVVVLDVRPVPGRGGPRSPGPAAARAAALKRVLAQPVP